MYESAVEHQVAALRFKERRRQRLIQAAVAKGATVAEAERAIRTMEGERPFLEWLLSVDWAKLIEFVLRLISMFREDDAAEVSPAP